MTERIRELAELAGAGWDDKYHWYVSSQVMEKFAELIIKECCKVIDDHYEPVYDGALIKKHFGVE